MTEINITIDGITLQANVRRATVGDGMRKAMLQTRVQQEPQEEYADQVAAYSMYPRCLGCTVEGTVMWPNHTRLNKDGEPELFEYIAARDLTPAEFVSLPAEIGDEWMTAAINANPAWDLAPEPASAEKKG